MAVGGQSQMRSAGIVIDRTMRRRRTSVCGDMQPSLYLPIEASAPRFTVWDVHGASVLHQHVVRGAMPLTAEAGQRKLGSGCRRTATAV